MAHAGFLGVHIELVVAVGGYLNGHIFNHLDTIALQTHALNGVISHQTHFCHAQNAKDISTHAVIAFIGLEAQMDIGIDGVHAVFLKLVGLDFVHQTDAASLLIHIHQQAFAFLFNHLHRHVQLLTALTAHRPEDIARGARGVNAHQDGFVGFPFAFDKSDVLQTVVDLAERYELEMTVLSG